MTDILTRLRGPAPSILAMRDAADEIERLQSQLTASQERVKALEDALRSFAKEFKEWEGIGCWDEMTISRMDSFVPGEIGITFGDLRRAAALLEKS